MHQLTEREKLIYLAALLEGEGCFEERAAGRPSPHGGKQFRINISMTDKDVIEWIEREFDSQKMAEVPMPGDYKTQYKVRWGSKAAKELALKVYPYMGERRRAKIEYLTEIGLDNAA